MTVCISAGPDGTIDRIRSQLYRSQGDLIYMNEAVIAGPDGICNSIMHREILGPGGLPIAVDPVVSNCTSLNPFNSENELEELNKLGLKIL